MELKKNDAGRHTEELEASDPQHGNSVTGIFKAAIYAQDVISLLDGQLLLTLGGRYDFKTSPELFNDAFSPRISASYAITDKIKLRTGFSKAFRFPSYSELYQDTWFFNVDTGPTGQAVPLSIFNPNPLLNPENIYNYDIGAEYNVTKEVTIKADGRLSPRPEGASQKSVTAVLENLAVYRLERRFSALPSTNNHAP